MSQLACVLSLVVLKWFNTMSTDTDLRRWVMGKEGRWDSLRLNFSVKKKVKSLFLFSAFGAYFHAFKLSKKLKIITRSLMNFGELQECKKKSFYALLRRGSDLEYIASFIKYSSPKSLVFLSLFLHLSFNLFCSHCFPMRCGHEFWRPINQVIKALWMIFFNFYTYANMDLL